MTEILPIFNQHFLKYVINVFLSIGMTRRLNLKIWRFLNVGPEQRSLQILIARVIWDHCLVLAFNFVDILSFPSILIFNLTECLKYKALKMTFGRGPLLQQKYKILQKRRQKLPVHDRNWEKLNMSRSSDNFFSMASCT